MGLFAVSVIATVVTANTTRAAVELLSANRAITSTRALYDAESGVDCAIARLRQTANQASVATDCTAGARVVTVSAPVSNRYTVASQTPSGNASMTVSATVERTVPSPFQQAAFGLTPFNWDTGINVTYGATLDSYHSGLGAYNDWIFAESRPNTAANADVRTNSPKPLESNPPYTYGAVTLWGDWTDFMTGVVTPSRVNGSAYYAAGGVVNDPSRVTGTIDARPTISLPNTQDPTQPSGGGCVTLPADLTLNGGTGTYAGACYIIPNITVDNAGALSFTAPDAKIYVLGNITVNHGSAMTVNSGMVRAGGAVLVSQANSTFEATGGPVELYAHLFRADYGALVKGYQSKPEHLRMFFTATGTSEWNMPEVKHNASVYATIYSPQSDVSIDNAGKLYGAAIANRVTLWFTGQMHFDEALKATTGWPNWVGQPDARLLAWTSDLTAAAPPPPTPTCGDGTCNGSETCSSCSMDCGTCSGPTCFLAGTLITLADGTLKPIEHIRVGDVVLAYDEETRTFRPDAVKETFVHPDQAGYLIVNDRLKVTANHPVYSNGAWVEIGTLRVGDPLLNARGEPEPIVSIASSPERVTVYNFEVNPYHTYLADGIVAHNKSIPLPGGG